MERFTNNFMISGEVTEELKEALQRAPQELLDMIWDKIVGEKSSEEVDRARKEEMLYQAIPEDLQKNIVYLDPDKLKLLIRVACGISFDIMYTATVNEEFVPRGWVFNFIKDGECVQVVMGELMAILKHLEEPEMQEKSLFSFYVRGLVNICLGLYGIVTEEQLGVMYQRVQNEAGGMEEELWNHIKETLQILEEQGMFWRDKNYIISPYLETKEEYRKLLREQKGIEYYVPDDEEIKLYVSGKMLEKSPEYEAVHKCLMKALKDSDMAEEMLEEIAGYIVRDEWDIPQIMNCLYQWDVAFNNEKSVHRMMMVLSEWLYGIHRWSECGHSRKEMRKENEELQHLSMDQKPKGKVVSGKVYPNDPCPCGSGKKYKKCCGK